MNLTCNLCGSEIDESGLMYEVVPNHLRIEGENFSITSFDLGEGMYFHKDCLEEKLN